MVWRHLNDSKVLDGNSRTCAKFNRHPPDCERGAPAVTGIAVGLAPPASFGYGTGSVLVRSAVRTNTASSVALWVQAVGFFSLVAGLAVVRPDASWDAVLWGLAAGALAAGGVLSFYTALQNGPISFVAPVSSTGVVVPVAGGLMLGEHVTLSALIGLTLVLVGVMVIARSTPRASRCATNTLMAVSPTSSPLPVDRRSPPFTTTANQLRFYAHKLWPPFCPWWPPWHSACSTCFCAKRRPLRPHRREPCPATGLRTTRSDRHSSLQWPCSWGHSSSPSARSPAYRHVRSSFTKTDHVRGGDRSARRHGRSGPHLCDRRWPRLHGRLSGSLDPVVAVLLASALFKEPLTVRRLVGLGACAVGIAFVAV